MGYLHASIQQCIVALAAICHVSPYSPYHLLAPAQPICHLHWLQPVLWSTGFWVFTCLPKDTLKNSLKLDNNRGTPSQLLILYIPFSQGFSASAASGGRYNKVTEMKTLNHIKMPYQQLQNPEPVENELMESTAVPLPVTGSVGSDWWLWA